MGGVEDKKVPGEGFPPLGCRVRDLKLLETKAEGGKETAAGMARKPARGAFFPQG